MIHKSENKIWTTWKVIKKETSKIQKTDNISQRRIQDKQINNPTDIADAFNKYFITDKLQTTWKERNAVKLLHKSENDDILEIKLIPTTETEIKHVWINEIKNSSGYEGISCRILKYCTHAIAKPLSHICNASLNQDIYPDD